ncbi:DeoR/GlpR family DNA-binding transcription regulator [Streptomyces sp. JJ36]|uniref:DeoR/GlpR family DNA-binding transcription regulator n=1 Tax=Streptomyces sp. JJ36 TaxID=2736645 RepID=UPI001F47165D|nr:DeoR/GlpR family DNA-binding transcription regulator [Streptomyces sp. JJ36]MCF6523765.1 DeoR/GlpR transcriptional regulator [Streptomyces sp. JJ36]
MSKEQRWSAVLEMLAARGRVEVEEAAARLGVSAATVRRDLDELAGRRLLVRTRGGAVAHGVSYELPLSHKAARHAPEKQRIARAVAELVARGEVVGLNGGTTTTEVARALAVRHSGPEPGNAAPEADAAPALTVVTNAVNIAAELAVRPRLKTVVTGGVARARTYELVGPLTGGVLDEVVLDVAVLGIDGIDPERGVMAHHEDEAAVSRVLAGRARRVIVAADASKAGRRAFARICPLEEVDALVTDASLPGGIRDRLGEAGITVHTV